MYKMIEHRKKSMFRVAPLYNCMNAQQFHDFSSIQHIGITTGKFLADYVGF